ncbi:hypothetical protein X777_12256 [Ooceraea biroi]|uniref:Uncharacterized protein n=1 Tax=Ooceraea biroi TaxID=2015173 RepID=A0A026W0D6_OOCBI|nr:hypothetical protein X777_12256 [Ooceraea biroi]
MESSESDSDNRENCDVNILRRQESINFNEQLSQWICEYNISHAAAGALLQLLKNVNGEDVKNLPLDPKTLLKTPKNIIVRDVPPGEYVHYGLKNAILDLLKTVEPNF